MKMFRRKDEGFTLVELMVVILIIGILVAIAIPVFNAARATADRRACHANQRTIEGASQQFVADRGGSIAQITAVASLTPEFIAVWPTCPTRDIPYVLTAGGTTCPDTGAGGANHGDFQQ